MENNKKFREELLYSVSTLTDEQLNSQIEEGRWTIGQILEHLVLMERAVSKAIVDALNKNESVQAEDKPIELAINRAVKVAAPLSVTPSDDFKTLHELQERLSASRQDLLTIVSRADEAELKQKSYPHPAFGQLSLYQWIPFIGYHEKRHLEQIEEIKAKLIN